MNAFLFYFLLILSVAGLVCSIVFCQGIAFAVLLSVSLLFPVFSLLKGITLLIKRQMILKFIKDELHGVASDTSENLTSRHHKAIRG